MRRAQPSCIHTDVSRCEYKPGMDAMERQRGVGVPPPGRGTKLALNSVRMNRNWDTDRDRPAAWSSAFRSPLVGLAGSTGIRRTRVKRQGTAISTESRYTLSMRPPSILSSGPENDVVLVVVCPRRQPHPELRRARIGASSSQFPASTPPFAPFKPPPYFSVTPIPVAVSIPQATGELSLS